MNEKIEQYVHKGSRFTMNFKLDKEHCSFSVYEYDRAGDRHQCTRKIVEMIDGYGFCKTHAAEVKRRLGKTVATETRYAARFSHGEPSLLELEVISETDKTIEIQSVKTILGSSYGLYAGKLRKDLQYTRQYEFFVFATAAHQWLTDKALEYVESCQKQAEKAIHTYNKLVDKGL